MLPKPIPPPNRIIREGESICWTCGGGRASHRRGALGHSFAWRDPYRKPWIDLPLSLPTVCLLFGFCVGTLFGVFVLALFRYYVGH
jgi:hypothetical protein